MRLVHLSTSSKYTILFKILLIIYKLFSIVFWAKWNDYFLYAMIILGVSLFTIAVSFVKTRLSLKKLYERAHYEIEVSVLRFEESGEKSSLIARNISSSNLVPGDIIEIPFNKKMPCDIVLLTGTINSGI